MAYILREWKASQHKQKEFLGDEYLDYNLAVALPSGRPCEETVISNAFKRLKRDANPDLRNVRAPEEPQPSTLDAQKLLEQLQQSPELLAALSALLERRAG